ncbi:hypothetical protein GPALN_014869 [Globodera pallida]|uniref:Uncharacterized protein n=1 Tax=Globodera pallida TaxID=36090 RepID=A0A183CDF3_GLOPA|nr:hypothetical protein GPALN_014869 [Globodera pallida]
MRNNTFILNASATPSISHNSRQNISSTTPTTSTSSNAEYQLSNQTGQGKRIVDSLWELELESIFGNQQHTEAVHQLIVALIIIALISIILISTVLLFRCYMLYCQDYPNVRRYQRPPTNTELQPMQQSASLPTVPQPLVPRHRKYSERATFRSVFEDDSPFIKV